MNLKPIATINLALDAIFKSEDKINTEKVERYVIMIRKTIVC